MRGQRERALLSLAFDTGLRLSQFVETRWPHVERGPPGGGRLFVPRSKADQEGAGAYAFMPARTMAALAQWRAACGFPKDGAILRRLHRTVAGGEHILIIGTFLSAQSATLVVASATSALCSGAERRSQCRRQGGGQALALHDLAHCQASTTRHFADRGMNVAHTEMLAGCSDTTFDLRSRNNGLPTV